MASPYDNIPGKIFIGGISPLTSQDSIQKYFGKYGDLSDCVLMQDKSTGKSRGFGFVTYRDSRAVDEVLSKPHILDGKEVDCKRAIPRDQQTDVVKEEVVYKTKKLFVGGIPQNTTEEEFRGYFESFGDVEDSVIMVDKETGKSRGFGFVTFDSEEAVDKVINKYFDNKIGGKWVECKRAQPKEVTVTSGKKVTPTKQAKENPLVTNFNNSSPTNSQNQQQQVFYQNGKSFGTPQKNQKLQNHSENFSKNNYEYLGNPQESYGENLSQDKYVNQQGSGQNQMFSPYSSNAQFQKNYPNSNENNIFSSNYFSNQETLNYSDTSSNYNKLQSNGQNNVNHHQLNNNNIFTFSNQLPNYFAQAQNSQHSQQQNVFSYGQGTNSQESSTMKSFQESSSENNFYQPFQSISAQQRLINTLNGYGQINQKERTTNMKLRETSRFADTAIGSEWSWNSEVQWK